MTDSDWWPAGYNNPAFTVQRQIYGPALGGDYVRGSTVATLPSTVLRFQTAPDPASADVQDKALLVTRPVDYSSAEIFWGWPEGLQDTWTEVALVRSGFGTPITVNDGQTVFRASKDVFIGMEHDILVPGPSVIDTPLQSGQWYYYSLFFKTSPLDWVLGMTSSVVIPRDYHHGDHLWDTLPPFYQYTDSNIRDGNGFLRNFLSVFGYELDVFREYVEQWQEVYHIDKCPMALLRHVGTNFGLAYQQGIGDIRRRALIAGLPLMLQMRGTPIALKQSILASKFDCDITEGTNLMLLPDDSDFAGGTGNWASLHSLTDALVPTVSTYADGNLYGEGGELLTDEPLVEALLVEGPFPTAIFKANVVLPPVGQGRGTMHVSSLNKTDETVDLAIACGDGVINGATVAPLYAGVPVEPGWQYGFSVQIKEPYPCTTNCFLFWFGAGGKPIDYLSLSSVTALPPPGDTNWHSYNVFGAAPSNAVYVVPVIAFTSRPSTTDPGGAYYDISGAIVYLLGQDNAVVVAPPDVYLTLGDPSDLIGDAQASGAPGGFIEKALGDPQ